MNGNTVRNILVNGMKSKVGGGKVILDTYLRMLGESRPRDRYFVLTPDREAYLRFETDAIKVIDVPGWAHGNLATLPLYHVIMPRLLARHAIDAILNFGDIVIPTNIPQIYNFDWAFAVYRDHISWHRLPSAEKTAYRLKLFFFKAYLARATIIMAQTEAMKARLETCYGLNNVVLVPAAVSANSHADDDPRGFGLPAERMKLVYPANYYPHKNIDILEPVAKALKTQKSLATIVTTLDADEHPGAAALLERIDAQGLGDILINVGRLPTTRVPALYQACDALLMPTLLETFGLPYVEAMHHCRPILTSDMDFAHAVCGNAALYFDPTDASSIAAAIERLCSDEALRAQLVKRGSERVAAMWNWSQVFERYQALIDQVLARHQRLAQ